MIHFVARYHPRRRSYRLPRRRLQPRGRGPGRSRGLGSHLLGQPEHAARAPGPVVRELGRDLPRARECRRLDDRGEGRLQGAAAASQPYASSLKKKIAVGVVEPPDAPGRTAGGGRRLGSGARSKCIPADKLILSTDCGFGRQGLNRPIAFYKAAAIAQGGTSSSASSASKSDTCPAPTKDSPGTSCRTTSRIPI